MNARALTIARGGQWCGTFGMISCPLPSHGQGRGDRNPSCKVWDGPDGVCVHCFGGCDWRDIKEELRRRGLLSAPFHDQTCFWRLSSSAALARERRAVQLRQIVVARGLVPFLVFDIGT